MSYITGNELYNQKSITKIYQHKYIKLYRTFIFLFITKNINIKYKSHKKYINIYTLTN